MRQVNRTPLAAALAVGLLAVVAAALVSPVSAAGHAVAIRDSSFGPKTITIRAGDRITWTNTGSNNHNVTFDTFASEEQMAPGAKYLHTFRSAGTFSYTCTLHGFTGTVVVKAAATPKPTVKPTPKPTPKPTAKPLATATAVATPEPTIVSPSPTAASSLAVAGSPGATASSAAPAAASSVAGPSASPGGGAAGDASQTGASGAPLALLVAIVAVGVVAVGAVVVRRR